jgi:hypothetical protein
MENNKKTSYLLLIIGILVLALAGSIGYIVGDLNSSEKKENVVSNNNEVMKEIEELKTMYDSKIAEKTHSFRELKEQKSKVESLMYALEKSKNDAQAMMKYKTQYQQLESKMRVLVNEIVALKSGKNNAVAKAKSTKLPDNTTVIRTPSLTKKEIPTAKLQNNVVRKEEVKTNLPLNGTAIEVKVVDEEKPQPKIEEKKIEEYRVSNLKVTAIYIKGSGKQEETDAATKTKVMKINFLVSGTKDDSKTYYIQVINSRNNVMGRKITEFFGDKSLTYSFAKSVDLTDGTINVTQEIINTEFEKGTYFINVFDKAKLVANSSITLK